MAYFFNRMLLGKQKEDDIDYALYSKEPSQLMKEPLRNG